MHQIEIELTELNRANTQTTEAEQQTARPTIFTARRLGYGLLVFGAASGTTGIGCHIKSKKPSYLVNKVNCTTPINQLHTINCSEQEKHYIALAHQEITMYLNESIAAVVKKDFYNFFDKNIEDIRTVFNSSTANNVLYECTDSQANCGNKGLKTDRNVLGFFKPNFSTDIDSIFLCVQSIAKYALEQSRDIVCVYTNVISHEAAHSVNWPENVFHNHADFNKHDPVYALGYAVEDLCYTKPGCKELN